MIDVQALVGAAREKYPTAYLGMDDEEVYKSLRGKFPRMDWPESSPYESERQVAPSKEPAPTAKKVQDYSPGIFEKIALAGLPEVWADEHDWAAKSYNNSMAGLIYQIAHGVPKYQIKDYENSPIWEDAAGFLVGLVSVPDVATFLGSGGLGAKAAQKVGGTKLLSWAQRGVTEATVQKSKSQAFAQALISKGALDSGFSLGTYGAAGGAAAEAARQRSEGEEFDYGKITAESGKAFLSGAIIGAASGGVAKGIMSPKLARAKLAYNAGDNSFKNLTTRLINSPIGQVHAEAQIFTAGQLTEATLMGEEISMDDYWRGLFTNTGIIGGMRLTTKPVFRRGENDLSRYRKVRKKLLEGRIKEKGSYDNIVNDLKDAGVPVPSELTDKLVELEIEAQAEEGAFKWWSKNARKVNELIEKSKKKELTEQEQADLMRNGTIVHNLNVNMYKTLKDNRELREMWYEDAIGRPLEPSDKAKLTGIINGRLKDAIEFSDFIQKEALGDKKSTISKEIEEEQIVTPIEDLPVREADNLVAQAQALKIPQESIDKYKGTGVSHPENPEGWNISGLKNLVEKGRETLPDTPANKLMLEKMQNVDQVKTVEGNIIERPHYLNPEKDFPLTTETGDLSRINRKTPILDALRESTMSDENKQLAYIGFKKFVRVNEKEVSPGTYKNLIDYFEWLNREGFSVKDATEALTTKYFESKGLFGETQKDRVTQNGINKSLAKFYGTGKGRGVEKIPRGFTYEYMEGHPVSGLIFPPEKGAKWATLDRSNWEKLDEVKSKIQAPIEGMPAVRVDALVDFFYNFGRRSVDVVNRLRVGDVMADGTLKISSGKKSKKGLLIYNEINNVNEVLPKFWGKLVELTKGRDAKELLFAKEDGKRISTKGLNNLIDQVLELAGAETKKGGAKEKFTSSDWRKSLFTDAERLGPEYVRLAKKLAGQVVGKVEEFYMQADEVALWKTLIAERGKPKVKEADVPKPLKVGDVVQWTSEGVDRFAEPRKITGFVNGYATVEGTKTGIPVGELFKPKVKRKTLAPKEEVIPATEEQVRVRNEWAEKEYPDVAVKFVEKLEPTHDGREVLGELVEHTAKIVKGKAPSDAIPHEMVEYAFPVLKAIGSPRAKNLIKIATKAFDGEHDAITKIGQYIDGSLEKGLVPKAKSWVKRFNLFLKELFGRKLAGKDAAFLLGEIVRKREGIPLKAPKFETQEKRKLMAVKKRYDDPNQYRGVVKRTFSTAIEHLGLSKGERDKFIDFINKTVEKEMDKELLAEMGKRKFNIHRIPKDMTPKLEDAYFDYLQHFERAIKVTGVERLRKIKSVTKFFKTLDIIKVSEKKNVTIAEREQLLKDFGVKDGKLESATQAQLNDYLAYVHTLETSGSTGSTFVDELVALGQSNKEPLATKFERAMMEVKAVTLPIHMVYEALGFEPLSARVKTHIGVEAAHYGEGLMKAERDVTKGWDITKEVDGKTVIVEHLDGIGGRRFDRIKNHMPIMDHRGEMYLEAVKFLKENGSELLPKELKKLEAEIKYFERAVKPEWKKTIKKDGIAGDALNALDKDGRFKYLNLKTDEGKVIARFSHPELGFTRYYHDSYHEAVRANLNKAEVEGAMERGDVGWIKDGIYISRIASEGARRVIDFNGRAFEKLIENDVSRLMLEEAQKKYKTLDPTMEQLEEFRSLARGIAIGNIADANNFTINKFSTKFLMKRHTKFPLFIKNDAGEWIRYYNNDYQGTFQRYAIGFGKYIAGVETFPEFGKLHGFKIPGVKLEIAEMKGSANRQWGNWVQETLERHLGIGDHTPFDISTTALQEYANVLAKTQLSLPFAGIKNVFTGTSQTVLAYDMVDVVRGFADIIREENRVYITEGGYEHLGTHIYEGGKLSSNIVTKALFAMGLMKPTERFNRHLAVLTSKYDQRRHVDYMRNNPKGSKLYEKGRSRIIKFYETPESYADLLEKYGYGHKKSLDGYTKVVDGKTVPEFESKFEQKKMERKMDTIHLHMNSMAHIKTQGASLSMFMPKFASAKGIRPLTLYKRMAYAATINFGKNAHEAVRSKNYMKLAAGTMATYFSGQALLGMYWHILGTPMPHENSGWFRQFLTALWRGEFLGLLSELFSPYFGESVGFSMYPAIYENAASLGRNLFEVGTGKKLIWGRKQAIDDFLRSSVSAYNGYQKIIERRTNPYNKGSIRFSKLYKDFLEEWQKPGIKVDIEFEKSKKSPYFVMMKNAFTKGSAEEFAEAFTLAYYSTASDLYNRGSALGTKGYSWNKAMKEANSSMKSSMKSLNPSKRPSKGAESQTKAKYKAWLDWLNKDESKGYLKELSGLEIEYNKRHNAFKKLLPYYFRKNNMQDLIKEFEWIHKP